MALSSRPEVVYVHVGAPKTGTTFLQAVLAKNRALLRSRGLLYPGPGGDHFLAAQDLHGAFRQSDDPRISGSWNKLVTAIKRWSGPAALISHETLMAITQDEMARIVDELPAGRIEIVITVRDLARQLPAVWQEDLKNGKAVTLPEFLDRVRSGPPPAGRRRKGFWLWQDLPRVLREWQGYVPAEQITVVTVPPSGSPPTLLWSRMAEAVRVDGSDADLAVQRTNRSLGVGEAELLRRINAEVGSGSPDALPWPAYRRHVKRFMAETVFAAGPAGPALSIGPEDLAWARETGESFAATIHAGGHRVVGDLADLVPAPQQSAPGRSQPDPDDVVDAAVTALVAMTRRLAEEQKAR